MLSRPTLGFSLKHKRNTMTNTLKRSLFSVTLAMSCLGTFANLRAQSELTFRSRTDTNAERDLQRLRDELNKAQDVNGPINPLGAFLQRDAEAIEKAKANDAAARLEIGPDERTQDRDSESERAPSLSPPDTKRQLSPAPITKPPKTAGVLPGPRYTIVQQASPQIRVEDGFRPARYVSDMEASVRPSLQSPVSLASANLPIVGQPTNVISNFQEIPKIYPTAPSTLPGGFAGGGGLPPGGMTPAPTNIMPNLPNPAVGNVQQVLPSDASNAPILPYPSNLSPAVNPNLTPAINAPGAMGTAPPIYSIPIQNGTSSIAGPPATYYPPPVNNPTLTGQAYNGAPLANPGSNVLPTYPRPAGQPVTDAPFVSKQPCQFDARYMVSREAYRQCSDPCAPRGSPYAPYATQPGGSPFSYVPQTGMAYNNNGYDSGYRPLIGFGQTLNNAYLGRGIVGQPTAYVDGQPVRNFIRYIFP